MVDNIMQGFEYSSAGARCSSGTGGEDGVMKEQDRLLPIANVGRIMKKILPPNAKISKEAKLTMQECVSEFISFVTGEASDKCRKEKRKTVNGDDVCWALGSLGFDDYAAPLKRYLHRHREMEGERANQSKSVAGERSTDEREEEEEGAPIMYIRESVGQSNFCPTASRTNNFMK
ncbi:PREDICTED: nuclear transcription factor Y subunit B-1-like [Ipomoea nil]|uniref:nuclear transcription factor Y subunit B-1-like n=1 Tax=Ipomoea nil TaxID=35883 RepID=UPI000901B2F1|nr:PREDICTED: nuclear transcription factor Y subunit B-1-like [Ipomoea nil]